MKSKILNILKSAESEYVSGETISNSLGISRTAIWKHIHSLQNMGYKIDGSSKKGYCLTNNGLLFNSYEIETYLRKENNNRKIIFFDSIDSTNNYLKKIANEEKEQTVVVADCQTMRKGRLGRNWESDSGKDIYFSVLLKPKIFPQEVQSITLAISVAVARTLSNYSSNEVKIKWPNDIIINNRKACGILTEMNAELDGVNYIVVGIGINVNRRHEEFNEELRDKASSLLENSKSNKELNRAKIVAELIKNIEDVYNTFNKNEIDLLISEYKSKCITLNREIEIINNSVKQKGFALDLTKEGKLVVRLENEAKLEVFSGEVSIRGVMGYI